MPSVLSDHDKETVKRTIPKSTNKIHAVAVARLYIAYPNKQRWVSTGLQGAAVLANDLVGNTYWIKLVDISDSNRGVIWDQEIYDPFYYSQDRTFFHSFELEDCFAGLSFVDEKEAKQFKKKMDDREKNASKATRATPFQGTGPGLQPAVGSLANGKPHHRFGLGSLLHGQRSSSAPQNPPPPPHPQSVIPPHQASELGSTSPKRDRATSLDTVDPSWRGLLGELLEMGITEDQIEENSDFIKEYIEQRKASGDPDMVLTDGAANGADDNQRVKDPPHHLPDALPGRLESITPQHTGSTVASKRGPAPAPPQPRRSRPDTTSFISQRKSPSPPQSPERTPSPPRTGFQFRVPPRIADAGKLANVPTATLPKRPRATSNVANPGPPPPPRPPKTPMEEDETKPRFGVPPPFQADRRSPGVIPPPPPPSRAPLAPARAPTQPSQGHSVPPTAAAPPPLPPKTPNAPTPVLGPPPPPLPPQRNAVATPPPPSLPNAPRPVPSAPTATGPAPSPLVPSGGAPPPPPLPPSAGAPPPPPLPPSAGAPPPPPLPSASGPPPPPLPPGREPVTAPPLPKPPGEKEDLLASIRGSGGIGGGRLKRVSSQEKRDRSAATIQGAAPSVSSGGGGPPAPPGGGGLGDALAAALSRRNKKVSASDDEDDDDDDWDEPSKRR